MKVLVTKSINIERKIELLSTSNTKKRNLKNKVYYFLSLLSDTNDNYKINNENDGFRNLCSSELKKMFGNKDLYLIRNLLLDKNDPIIQINNSWHNPKEMRKSGFCQGYKLTQKYNSGIVEYKTISGIFEKHITKYMKSNSSKFDKTPNYQLLLSQYETNLLKIDPMVNDYILNFAKLILQKIKKNNKFQIDLLKNHIGRWLYYCSRIEKNNIWKHVSSKNHRLNSSFTNLPKQLRSFVLCNNSPLYCVDISSSQPYILASIMDIKFFQEKCTGYNFKTIYPELYSKFENLLIPNKNYNQSTTDQINFTSNYTGTTNNNYSSNKLTYSSFMWCSFFNDFEIKSIISYQNAPFNRDFYSYVISEFDKLNYSIKHIESREKIKNSIMFALFDENNNHRNHNEGIQIFKSVYPGVDKWICNAHEIIGRKEFSYLLQRTESYLLLEIICKEFSILNPAAPLFTIHDAIFTTETYVYSLNKFVLRRLKEVTGIDGGCKIKPPQIEPNPQLSDIEKVWIKIRPIDSQKKYNKNCYGVFSSNIKRGSDFLENFGANFLKGIDDQI